MRFPRKPGQRHAAHLPQRPCGGPVSYTHLSGEDWDIIYTADWCFYNAQATKQGFWEITQEALETYAPMTAGSMYHGTVRPADVMVTPVIIYKLPRAFRAYLHIVYFIYALRHIGFKPLYPVVNPWIFRCHAAGYIMTLLLLFPF